MEVHLIKAQKRSVVGKQVKKLRVEGRTPAILYGHGVNPITIDLDSKVLWRLLTQVSGASLIALDVDGEEHNVLIRDIQYDVLTRDALHVDFLRVAMDETISTMVPIELVGESPAVTQLGCILVSGLNEIEIEALPRDLPDRVTIDISVLKTTDDSITVADIDLGEGVQILTDNEEVIAGIVVPAIEAEPEVEAEEEVLFEEVAEPEVIERGKKEDDFDE
ncbi:MAG: 50S ribosomal protein L25 [Anaerolineales bacterium]|nr:50S ribosomal protein L25 [Anaerolineales bacterium]